MYDIARQTDRIIITTDTFPHPTGNVKLMFEKYSMKIKSTMTTWNRIIFKFFYGISNTRSRNVPSCFNRYDHSVRSNWNLLFLKFFKICGRNIRIFSNSFVNFSTIFNFPRSLHRRVPCLATYEIFYTRWSNSLHSYPMKTILINRPSV